MAAFCRSLSRSLGAPLVGCRHGGDQAFQHVGLIVIIFDQGKRVQANFVSLVELHELAAEDVGELLVGTANVDHPDLRPGGEIGVDEIIGEEALARS